MIRIPHLLRWRIIGGGGGGGRCRGMCPTPNSHGLVVTTLISSAPVKF